MTLELSPQSAMIAGSYQVQKHPPDMSILEGMGYTLVPISRLDVLYCNPYLPDGDYSLRELADMGRYDVVLSGPDIMLAQGQYPSPPSGPVFRNGGLQSAGNKHAPERGVVAVLRDGTVVMGRANGASAEDLQKRFGQQGNPVRSALGGGVVLLENGRKVSQRDLLLIQRVGRRPGGFYARSMDNGVHTIMGIRKGRADAAWGTTRSGLDIQSDFYRFGFGCVLKFAHGSNVFFDDCIERLNGRNSTGFGVTRAH